MRMLAALILVCAAACATSDEIEVFDVSLKTSPKFDFDGLLCGKVEEEIIITPTLSSFLRSHAEPPGWDECMLGRGWKKKMVRRRGGI